MADTPLRIGYVVKRFPRFSETFILNEVLALEAQGISVEVFSLLDPPDEPRHARLADLRAPVTRLADTPAPPVLPATGDAALFAGTPPLAAARLMAKAGRVAEAAQARGLHHLHAHFASDAASVALLAGRAAGLTFSMTAHARDIYHDYIDPQTDAAKRRAKLMAADFTVTVSDFNLRHMRTLCPEAAPRIHRLYNGIDLAAFHPAPVQRAVPGRILAIGRLVEKKGFADLIAACALLQAQGRAFDCRIIGDGPLRAPLTDQIAALGLQGKVQLLGPMPQEHLAAALEEASLVTLPCIITPDGDRDGLPTVLLEAMAKALPVVTTTVTGGPEIVADGITGLLVPPGSPAALATALGSLIDDPARAQRMGRLGRQRAESLFDLRASSATLAGLFAKAARHPLKGAA
ncbi:colanic acid biosynthesis glycosyltransferase WcaL [Tabrizicola sp. TH137]|uniref:glycosyltransferase n=1 Tax=Tabrizicola sp. TH137 TaxID=2067452 RepID=UPI000C7A297C|nr:glycosyltransferase [Tabrizicola sp. TH137]PLL13608.1 colanic acid biosynthesis glycosyltransferase WcaL [Tabrizicola sp. TH137]